MRKSIYAPLGLMLILAAASSAMSQQALDRLEKKLGAPKAAGQPTPADLPPPRVDSAAKASEPGYLGVVTDEAEERGRGVRVTEVVPGSPAQDAGLKVGDLVTAIDGEPIRQMSDVPPRMKGAVAGAKVGITVVRSGETRTIHVTLGRRPNDPKLPPPPPEAPGEAPAKAPATDKAKLPPPPVAAPLAPVAPAAPGMLGIVMRSYADDPRLVLGRPPIRGVQITDVLPNSPAASAGLRVGDIIVALNEQAMDDRQVLRDALSSHAAGEQVELTFYRGRVVVKQKVRLAAAVAPADGVPLDRLPPPPGGSDRLPPAPGGIPGGIIERPTDQQRIEALEQRVLDLERRIEVLEKRAKAP